MILGGREPALDTAQIDRRTRMLESTDVWVCFHKNVVLFQRRASTQSWLEPEKLQLLYGRGSADRFNGLHWMYVSFFMVNHAKICKVSLFGGGAVA